MSSTLAKDVDLAFKALGTPKPGLVIWRIEKLQVVSVPKDQYGKFYTGDSYIILKTTPLKAGGFSFAIHFWLGKETSQDEAGAAAIKSVELDAFLGGKAVQYREVQGHETDLFLSYFRPCIIALPGGVTSGFKKPDEVKKEKKLWQLKGTRFVRVRQVPFARTSLSHSDVYILDTPDKVFQFNGANATRSEQGKALEVTQAIKSLEHEGKCEVAIIEDGKLGDEDSNEFWAHFGGYAPIAKKSNLESDVEAKPTPAKLIWAGPDGLKEFSDGGLKKSMLDSNKCYIVDIGSEIYVWIGRISSFEERKSVSLAAENLILKGKRPPSTQITRVTERYETPMFKSNFDEWPSAPAIGDSSSKLKGMLKQAGVVDIKSVAKGTPPPPVETSFPPLTEFPGKLEIWRVEGGDKVPLPTSEVGKFYSGDSYIVKYTYVKDRKNEYLVFFWLGRNSSTEERGTAAILATKLVEQLRGHHILARVVQGKEPEQFLSLFKGNLVFLKGGLGNGYKKVVGSKDDTYSPDSVALFHIKGTTGENFRATQVQPVASSLSSSDCFFLQTPSTVFLWLGQFSSETEKKAVVSAAQFLRPGSTQKQLVEGKEVSLFWQTLGGKGDYPRYREGREIGKDARLFIVSNATGVLKLAEVYNFTQEDLLSEDVMILDVYHEIFVWIGNDANEVEKKEGLEIAQKYLEYVGATEHRSKDTALIKVVEGNEPPMFTAHFAWDPTKAPTFVDPYERKLAELQGRTVQLTEAQKRKLSLSQKSDGSTSQHVASVSSQRAAALAALSGSQGGSSQSSDLSTGSSPLKKEISSGTSQRNSAMAALSGALTAEKHGDAWGSLTTTKVSELKPNIVAQPEKTEEKKEAPPVETKPVPPVEDKPNVEVEPQPTKAEPIKREASISSQRAAALAALSGALTAEKAVLQKVRSATLPKQLEPETKVEKQDKEEEKKEEVPEASEEAKISVEEVKVEEKSEPEAPVTPEPIQSSEEKGKEGSIPYSRLKVTSDDPASDIDLTKRESYLSDAEFERLFHVSKEAFYALPKWKRDQKKKLLDLF